MPSRKPNFKWLGGNKERERLYEAQLLIDRALDEDDPDRQIALAQAALELSPDCPEAYQILADYASSAEEAIPPI